MIFSLHKIGRRREPANYRPTKHNTIVPRSMERLNKDNLIVYLLDTEPIIAKQHGFLRRKCGATCMTTCVNFITKALNKKRSVTLIFLHTMKAFDRVPHRRLLNNIESYFIVHPNPARFSSYIS